ncbi:LLM class flavin-dependent oxidoreductase [Nocardioides sp. NPDC127503]|uniref:LLM class flavin-dependent oxidoreductase n=1 Tax=Nocardioides sp. NPDC127503 TaxID=3154516 RepID=UPI003322DBD4
MSEQPVEFYGIVEGGYPNIPYAGDRPKKTAYVDLPNSHYDPIHGQRVLETQLELLASMERFGLDGAGFTEQHNGPIGSVPNALMAAAWLAARTDRIKLLVNGPLMNAYQSPVRLAEEIALADVLSKGRLLVGLPIGLGAQYHSLGMNPATARERHAEGHDLLVKALTEPGPFEWHGKYFDHNYVNIWPRPAHPIEFNLPGGGSLETLELAAKRRYTYQTVLNERRAMIAVMNRFRDLCRGEGYEPDPKQCAVVVEIHVAETDAEARRECEAGILWNYQNYFEAPLHDKFPPGYTSAKSYRGITGSGFSLDTKSMTYDDLVDNNWLVAGSPETVTAKLQELIADTGAGRLFLGFSMGIKHRWLVEKCLTIFSEQVLPHFRPNGRPLWAEPEAEQHGYRSALEYATKRKADVPTPSFVQGGYLRDVRTAHLDGVDERIRPYPAAETNHDAS